LKHTTFLSPSKYKGTATWLSHLAMSSTGTEIASNLDYSALMESLLQQSQKIGSIMTKCKELFLYHVDLMYYIIQPSFL
jgi:hypothetical protein